MLLNSSNGWPNHKEGLSVGYAGVIVIIVVAVDVQCKANLLSDIYNPGCRTQCVTYQMV